MRLKFVWNGKRIQSCTHGTRLVRVSEVSFIKATIDQRLYARLDQILNILRGQDTLAECIKLYFCQLIFC